MGLHHFSHFGVDEPPPFGPMRYHNRIACCDAFAILECGRINFPTCIAYPPNTAGDCDIVREMRFIHIGYVDGRQEPTHTFVMRMAAQRTMKADTTRFQQIGRASCRVRVSQSVLILVVAVPLKTKISTLKKYNP